MSKLDYGYNIPALKGMMLEEIQTPCLLIDYERFKLNVEKMGSFTHENNISQPKCRGLNLIISR